ncbi:hypothetical protein MIS24_16805, partial [Vibrio parahaemolyticus]|nr:hypothetical protein [Vibrio parahaemolyticus]
AKQVEVSFKPKTRCAIQQLHVGALKKLRHNDTFNIRCTVSHINMPCAVNKIHVDGDEHQENIFITVMRKKDWKSKDPKEFLV